MNHALLDEFRELSPYHSIFTDNNVAIDFMVEHCLLLSVIPCHKDTCSGLMNIQSSSSYIDGRVYRCQNNKCKKKVSIKNGSKFESLNIEFKKILRSIYCWVYSYTNYQAIGLCEISEPSYIQCKEIIMEVIASSCVENIKIGGPGIRVQFDETAICNGLVVSNPSNELDNIPQVQWILGGVVEGNCREMVLVLVPNRKWKTILNVLEKHVYEGSYIITDGYPSYPRAIREFGSVHEIVNHSVGFVNNDGGNTNQIENLWSHLKQDYRGRGGVNHNRIKLFLEEFAWKKRNLDNSFYSSIKNGFVKIIDVLKRIFPHTKSFYTF